MITSTMLEIHEYCSIFPPLPDAQLRELADDIEKNGLGEEIVTLNGKILDGRNRYLACLMAGVEPRFIPWTGECGSPLAYVVSMNLHRRHLDESQRGMVGAKLKPMFEAEAKARQSHGQTAPGRTLVANLPEAFKGRARDEAADLVNVSPRTVAAASRVLHKGTLELINAVERGEVKVSAAATVASLPRPEQAAVVARGAPAVKDKAKKIREEKTARKEAVPGETFADEWIGLWKKINIFLVSLPRRGGIVSLVKPWKRDRIAHAVSVLEEQGTVCLQSAKELRETYL